MTVDGHIVYRTEGGARAAVVRVRAEAARAEAVVGW